MVSYKSAGVDIEKGNKLVAWLKKKFPHIGDFSGTFELNKDFFLVASCDGVGTKLKIATLLNKYDTVGIDLVAMNVNDVVCCGAKPLFFLDYLATSKLDLKIAKEILRGIITGCKMAGCVLLGGETAEMPGFYSDGDYELAGFAVGIIKKSEIINTKNIRDGDLIFGIPSSGLHSNGFSLVRKIFSLNEIKKFGETLLTPTKIYVNEILELKKRFKDLIHGVANITGGGFYDNIERVLPENTRAVIHKESWDVPEIFEIIQKKGSIETKEMYRTFNMGIGMIFITDKELKWKLKKYKLIGEVAKGQKKVVIV